MSIWIPRDCPRGRNDCEALATIKSDCGKSFVCSGLNDGSSRELEQDKFTFCFKNEKIDEMSHNDEQDMRDMLSVVAQALSADWHINQNKEEKNNELE